MKNLIVRVGDSYLNMTLQAMSEGVGLRGDMPRYITELFEVVDEEVEYIEVIPTKGGWMAGKIRYYRDGKRFVDWPSRMENGEAKVVNSLINGSLERAFEKDLHGGLDGQ